MSSPSLLMRPLEDYSPKLITTKNTIHKHFYGIPDKTKLKLLFIPVAHEHEWEPVFLNWPQSGMVPLFKLVSIMGS